MNRQEGRQIDEGVNGDDYVEVDFSPPTPNPPESPPKNPLMVPLPPFSKWRSSTRIIIINDMVFSWVFIGFCGFFLTKISLALVHISTANKTANYSDFLLGAVWLTLSGVIVKKMTGMYAILKVLQAVIFAHEREQVEDMSKSWRLMSLASLITCPLLISAICVAMFWLPPGDQELSILLASFGVTLVCGWFWRMWTYYVVYMFLKEL